MKLYAIGELLAGERSVGGRDEALDSPGTAVHTLLSVYCSPERRSEHFWLCPVEVAIKQRNIRGLICLCGDKIHCSLSCESLTFTLRAVMGSGMKEGGYCPRWWNQDVVVGIWVVVSVSSCAVWHINLKMEGIARAEEVLVTMCEGRARMLQDQFAVSVNHVHAIAIPVSTFHYQKTPSALDQETFDYYSAETAFERPLLSGVAYAQRVLGSGREKFEKQQGWTIKTMKEEPSPEQEEYAPVIFSQKTISYIRERTF